MDSGTLRKGKLSSFHSMFPKDYDFWDSSELIALLSQFELQFNHIHYAAYRSAAKLEFLQKIIKFNQFKLGILDHFLNAQGLSLIQNGLKIRKEKIFEFIEDLYQNGARDGILSIPDSHIQLLMSLFFYMFDSSRSGEIEVIQLKVTLAAFSAAKPLEKYKWLFQQYKHLDNTITKEDLTSMLFNLAKIPEMLGEKLSFGTQLVPAAVESCFLWNNRTHYITEKNFLNWMMQEPQTLVWISTHFRLVATEAVVHQTRCSICKCTSIQGLRYRCLKCFQFNLCQKCFLSGVTSKGHKLKHPLQEFCQPTSSWEETKLSFKTLKNKFNMSQKRRQSYLSINPFFPQPAYRDEVVKSKPEPIAEYDDNKPSKVNNEYWKELESIILRLEDENRQLHLEIEKCHNYTGSSGESQRSSEGSLDVPGIQSRQEMLEDHTHQLNLQIQRLRKLKNLFSQATTVNQATPNIRPLPALQRMLQRYASTPNNEQYPFIHSPVSLGSAIKADNETQDLSTFTFRSREEPRYCSERLRRSFETSDNNTPSFTFTRSFSTFTPRSKSTSQAISVKTPPKDVSTLSSISAGNFSHNMSLPTTAKQASSSNSLKFTFSDLTPSMKSTDKESKRSDSFAFTQVEYELQTIMDQLEKILPVSTTDVSTASFSKTKALYDLNEARANVNQFTAK